MYKTADLSCDPIRCFRWASVTDACNLNELAVRQGVIHRKDAVFEMWLPLGACQQECWDVNSQCLGQTVLLDSPVYSSDVFRSTQVLKQI
ncbi:hypothetical protein D3D01_19820 [Haloarcula sp. Atlit-7R]|nr:hypothetical protein D3D01_19820 [Haloarcula sp. Atlit-7R]